MTEKCNTLQIHIFIYPYMDTSKQYIIQKTYNLYRRVTQRLSLRLGISACRLSEGECLSEWAELLVDCLGELLEPRGCIASCRRSDSLSESPCSLTRVVRQCIGGLTNTAKANPTISNESTPYGKCSCPHELFEQITHMVSWFHLMSLVIFHLKPVEAVWYQQHVWSQSEKLIWT